MCTDEFSDDPQNGFSGHGQVKSEQLKKRGSSASCQAED
jgi:hypothetical protein